MAPSSYTPNPTHNDMTEQVHLPPIEFHEPDTPDPREAIQIMVDRYASLKILSPDDEGGYKTVKRARLDLRQQRLAVERKRKELKDAALTYGRQVDSAAREILEPLVQLEDSFKEQEKAYVDEQERRRLALIHERMASLVAVEAGGQFTAEELGGLSEEAYQEVLKRATEAHEAKKAEEAAEAERKRQEAEEQARKAKELEEREAALAKREAELKAKEAAAAEPDPVEDVEALLGDEPEEVEAEVLEEAAEQNVAAEQAVAQAEGDLFILMAQAAIEAIIAGGMIKVRACPEEDGDGHVFLWAGNAQEQIAEALRGCYEVHGS